ncbi:MAG: hypothetical protein AAFZ15_18315 [Bacteroidota bacterium]
MLQRTVQALFGLLLFFTSTYLNAQNSPDYGMYHKRVMAAEKLIIAENYQAALHAYEQLFNNYDFIFLREYKIAVQLAWHLQDEQKTMAYLKKGILAGWELKSIKKNKYLSKLGKGENWKTLKKEYPIHRKQYQSAINRPLRDQVKKMISRDQKKALRAFLTFGEKAKKKYAEKKFAPQSEKQIAEFSSILKTHGYPGEKLIGNNFWMSTIISHHNSISTEYGRKDQLYPTLKPLLKKALKKGEISPFEFALIDDWYITVKNDRTEPAYGILDAIAPEHLPKVNELRQAVFLRPVEVRNGLVDAQEKTGIDFYLRGHTWGSGKIEIK